MRETIREIYTNIHSLIFNSVNGFIGQKFDKHLCAHLENQIIYTIKYQYPQFDFNFSLHWDEYNYSLNPKFELSSKYFPIMKTENYITHDFIDCPEGILLGQSYNKYLANVLKCQKCNIKITDSGNPIDEDLNCAEMIIKNIIE
jgi:hypothetical protein